MLKDYERSRTGVEREGKAPNSVNGGLTPPTTLMMIEV